MFRQEDFIDMSNRIFTIEQRAQMSASRKFKRGTLEWLAAYSSFIRRKEGSIKNTYNTVARRSASRKIGSDKLGTVEYQKLVEDFIIRKIKKMYRIEERKQWIE